MLGDAERRACRRTLRRLGEGRGHAELGGVEGQGAATHREGQNEQAHARCRTNHESPGKQKGAPSTIGPARPKATASYMPMGAFRATWAPIPITPALVPSSSFSVSYATCRPSIPSPRLAPMTQPTLDSVEPPVVLCQRFEIETYGSMLIPGVGTFTLRPAPVRMCVIFGKLPIPVVALEVDAPS